MLIDKLRTSFIAGMTVEPVREWTVDGHQVGVYRADRPADGEDAGSSEIFLACDCDCPEKDEVRIVGGEGDPDKCPARLKVRAEVMAEAHAMLAPVLAKDGLKSAILEIHRRVQAKEYLGQHYGSMIYVQEVAEILTAPQKAVWQACGELFAEEKLELNGAILTEYEPRFRIPLEMAAVLMYAVEEPLGWPNGDAGMIRLREFEAKVQEATGIASGKAAFGPPFPRADLALLASILEIVARALRGATADDVTFDFLKKADAERCEIYAMFFSLGYPQVDTRVLAHCAAEFIRVALDRIEIDAAMRKGMTPQATLGEMAEYYERQAAHFRAQTQKPQG